MQMVSLFSINAFFFFFFFWQASKLLPVGSIQFLETPLDSFLLVRYKPANNTTVALDHARIPIRLQFLGPKAQDGEYET